MSQGHHAGALFVSTTSLVTSATGETFTIDLEYSRDDLLTEFGKAALQDRYLMPGEEYQQLFARVSGYYATDDAHARRLYSYISKLWFMPATPVLSNGGTKRGFPISCFLNSVGDNLERIISTWTENAWLAARGGGIGTYWGDVRSIGERVGEVGKTSGVVPFIKVMDSLTLAISQGSLRRGSAAVYLPIWHPEIEEFIDIRKPTGGDPNRRSLNLHNAVVIPDEFMRAIEAGGNYALRSPKTNEVIKLVDARTLWAKLLTMRIETGEPYILFIDNVNRAIPEHHKLAGLYVKQSNLCSEITEFTGIDHYDKLRSAVCCLSSLNLMFFDDWKDDDQFIYDIVEMLDNVLQDFIVSTEGVPEFEAARYSAMRERSIGLGAMGLHSYLQSHMIAFESPMAKGQNLHIFSHIKEKVDAANFELAIERGPCPDAEEYGITRRFSNATAIAPTASISIIAGGTSPCIEPWMANSFTQKTLSGSYNVRNRALESLLEDKGMNTTEVWSQITTAEGSVQHLDFLDEREKHVFKTAHEIDQRWIIEMAGDRALKIDQAQSINLFLPADAEKHDIHGLHWMAWKQGVKSLYYLRSKSVGRADVVGHNAGSMPHETREDVERVDYDECLACT